MARKLGRSIQCPTCKRWRQVTRDNGRDNIHIDFDCPYCGEPMVVWAFGRFHYMTGFGRCILTLEDNNAVSI